MKYLILLVTLGFLTRIDSVASNFFKEEKDLNSSLSQLPLFYQGSSLEFQSNPIEPIAPIFLGTSQLKVEIHKGFPFENLIGLIDSNGFNWLTLKNLDDFNNPAGNNNFKRVCDSIEKNISIEILVWDGIITSEERSLLIEKIIKTSKSLKSLDLGKVSRKNCSMFLNATLFNQNFKGLRFWFSDLDKETFIKEDLFEGLANSKLQTLDLSYSKMKSYDIKNLFEKLKSSNNLQTLCLNGINLDNNACILIADYLSNNTTLKTLEIEECNIGFKGALIIAKTKNKNLNQLKMNIVHNHVGIRKDYINFEIEYNSGNYNLLGNFFKINRFRKCIDERLQVKDFLESIELLTYLENPQKYI